MTIALTILAAAFLLVNIWQITRIFLYQRSIGFELCQTAAVNHQMRGERLISPRTQEKRGSTESHSIFDLQEILIQYPLQTY